MTLLIAMILAAFAASAAEAAPPLKPGDPFPSWSLPAQDGSRVDSATLRGRTYLLWFYPKAMTPGCTTEGRGLRDRWVDFQKLGVEIFGVSFDPPAVNEEFRNREQFPFPLLSDSDRSLALAVGAAESPAATVPRRISYLIGADGKVRRVYDAVVPASHAGDVLGDLVSP